MSSPKTQRVDVLLVEQGLAKSRTHAQALVMGGAVCVGDYLVKKSSETFPPETSFRLKAGSVSQYVSRGGNKLAGALKTTGLKPEGFVCLDVGASTGGFTDCLLQNGAAKVYAIDVGHNQIDWKIRQDPRVIVHEGVNARELKPDFLPERVQLVVSDVSFISLTLVLKPAIQFLAQGGYLLALVKPQFEVGKGQVGKGGIVKDPLLHQVVQEKITEHVTELGLVEARTFPSPIEGADGNKEFFIFARRPHGAQS